MNNVFDIKRFGDYFLYDLRRARNNYGLSLLMMGLTPVLLFIIHVFLGLVSGKGVNTMPAGIKAGGIILILLAVVVISGPKLYGFLTDKRAGADFLMLPASTFEKWLSMVIMVCIVLPVAIVALLFASDALLSLVLPQLYGGRIFDLHMKEVFDNFQSEGVSVNYVAIIFFTWCQSVLFFTLGGIFFKKAKVAQSMLCLMALGMLLSSALGLIVNHGGSFDLGDFAKNHAEEAINWAANIWYVLTTGLLLWGTWYRLRSLKH